MLVAEDNAVNRRLAVAMLEKRGHSVVFAHTGREAVEAVRAGGVFDLVLMDMQMPEMDGFEATAAIRDPEKDTGGRLPIVALTAHSMKGDARPASPPGWTATWPSRFACLSSLRSSSGLLRAATWPRPRPTGMRLTIDPDDLCARLEGDRELMLELAELFLTGSPHALSEVRRAIDASDAPELLRAAHTLKGSLSCFGATTACASAHALEMMGHTGDLTGADARLADLVRDVNHLTRGLAAIVARIPAA